MTEGAAPTKTCPCESDLDQSLSQELNVLLVGSGGREHALAEAMDRSARLGRLSVAPGNAGTERFNIKLDVSDHSAVVRSCKANAIDLVVVGPEAPLVAGLADVLTDASIPCLGPSQAAARLEASKSFARSFAESANIAQPWSATFTDSAEALVWLDQNDTDVVVKADGLAGGKGVVIPADRSEARAAVVSMLDHGRVGSAGSTVVLEEKMVGEELSLFGISDGAHVLTLGTAQDHKRVGAQDQGPNTGGMGAFSPVPGVDSTREADLAAAFLEPAIAEMAARGTPYVGVLYAGIMVTGDGPKLIEYNCRFGDPEAQVILPLIDGDVVELFWAAANRQLGQYGSVKAGGAFALQRRGGAAAVVVVAADGYPDKPRGEVAIPDLGSMTEYCTDNNAVVYHAGTSRRGDGSLVSSGGRVLAVTGKGDDLDQALKRAYSIVDAIVGDGLFARPDIGWRHSSVRGRSEPSVGAQEQS